MELERIAGGARGSLSAAPQRNAPAASGQPVNRSSWDFGAAFVWDSLWRSRPFSPAAQPQYRARVTHKKDHTNPFPQHGTGTFRPRISSRRTLTRSSWEVPERPANLAIECSEVFYFVSRV